MSVLPPSEARLPGAQQTSRSYLWQITEAENSEEALAAVAKERPDLILMEIQLPSVDGYETMRRIRANPLLLLIPIIVVTAYAPSGEKQKALSAFGEYRTLRVSKFMEAQQPCALRFAFSYCPPSYSMRTVLRPDSLTRTVSSGFLLCWDG